MNHVYRIIWSDAANTFVAVAETAGSRGKRSLGKRARALRALALAASLITGANSLANPTGGAVSAGQGSIVSSGAVTTINQATPKMAINWQGFNIAAGETVNFVQPGSSAVALNRVLGTDGTQILGKLNANGQVFILNPNGVLFGKDAQVSVGALVASTLQMSDSDFMTGKMTFSGQGGAVTNYGNITANGGGTVALLGGKVSNEGTITAKLGAVALGAGEQVTLDFSGDGLLKMAVDRGLADALTRNSGLIQAEGGRVIMAAQTADALRASVVNNEGVIQARSLENHGGVIRLSGTQILNSGSLDVAGSGGANGGSITVDAGYAMQNSGSLNVSGAQGGSIKVNTHNLIDMGQYDASGSVQGGSIMIVADNHMEQTTAAALKADGGAGSGGTIRIDVAHDAWLSGSASANGRTGGEIAVTSADLVMAGANVSATGKDSGGRIRIGGGWQGGDADLRNAGQTRLVDTHLDVSATGNGNGGTAVVWSDNATLFGGQIDARGGVAGGDGGKVEVSSHGQLGFGGNVDTAAPKGRSGQLLLDPKNIEIVDSVSGILILPLAGFAPAADVQFGGASIVEVPFSNALLIASPHEKYLTAGDSGAVRLYSSTTGALNGTLSGTSAGDQVGSGGIVALGNGNYIVNSPLWSNPVGNAKVGAVTWLGAALTLPASISTLNSLIGSTSNDQVGSGGISVSTYASSLGNYLVKSPLWNYSSTNQRAGAVSLGSGVSGIKGSVNNGSSGNSLSGSTLDDQVGSGDVKFLPSGNYVVSSPGWDDLANGVSNAGAVSYMKAIAPSGLVSAANSLFGTTPNDQVGSGGITVLGNSNYLVSSPNWSVSGSITNVGAFSFGSSTGLMGKVDNSNTTSGNSLSGSITGDMVSSGGIEKLTNGNYVVMSPNWSNGSTNSRAGAVTWGSSTTAMKGVVSATGNSLTGSNKNDQVGSDGIEALTNGNYVVVSQHWANGTANPNAGAVTFASGTVATKTTVTASNSLVGALSGDTVGSGGVTLLSNGNYVVSSPHWSNGSANPDAGAVTWGSSTTALKGVVSTTGNSLTGSVANDSVGSGGIKALLNGNYVVDSPYWNNVGTTSTATSAGAVSWINGSSAAKGTVTTLNSLYGTSNNDRVGYNGVTVLGNGNYVVGSQYWAAGSGAVNWGSASVGAKGVVSIANSYIGKFGDQVGSGGITELSNGDYVVNSPKWSVSSSTGQVGAVTKLTGTGVSSGIVSSTNSFTGSQANDAVGSGGITPLANGNFVVRSPDWQKGSISGAGAVSWVQSGAEVGVVSVANSLLGSSENDNIGSGTVRALPDGRALVASPLWDASGASNAGRVDILAGKVTLASGNFTYALDPSASSTVLTTDLRNLLSSGSTVTLQANNDITLHSNLTGNGGNLSLQAGRSILLNGDIVSNGGNVTLKANESAATSTYRDTGTAIISMASNTKINAGSGNVTIALGNGVGLTYSDSGNISLGGIIAATISTINKGTAAASGIVLNDTLSASGSGNSIVLAGNVFTNATHQSTLSTPNGYWRVWSVTPEADDKSGLSYDFKQYNVSLGGAVQGSNNGFLYSRAPFITPDLIGTTSKIYDGTNVASLGASNFSVTGALDHDIVMLNNPQGSYGGADVGNTIVTVNGLAMFALDASGQHPVYGYGFPVTPISANIGTINPFQVKLTGQRTYDGTTNAPPLTMNVLPNNETLNLSPGPATIASKNAGTYANVSGVALVSNPVPAQGNANNYVLADGQHNINITQAPLTLTPTGVSKTYDGTTVPDSGSVVAVTPTQVFNSDRIDGYNIAYTDRNAGPNKVVQARNARIVDTASTIDSTANYVITYADSTAAIAPRVVNLSGSRTYDGSRTLSPDKFVIGHLVNGETLSLSGSVTVASKDVGLYSNISGLDLGNAPAGSDGLAANYTLSGGTHTASITPFAVNIVGTRAYDGATVTDGGIFTTVQKVGNETLKVTGSGSVANKDVGAGQSVTSSVNNPLTLADGSDGSKASNYLLASSGNVATIVPYVVSLNGERSYDGSANIAAAVLQSSLVAGKLVNNESLTLSGSGTAASKDAGRAALASLGNLTLADGANGGLSGNYTLSGGTHTATITQAGLTLTTEAVNKIYDGTLAANGTAVVVGGSLVTGDTVSGGTYAYLDKNAGTGKSVSVSGITVNDGNGGGNYAVSYVNNTSSVITPAPLTLSSADVNKVYDGGLAAKGTPVVISGTLFGDTLSGGTYAYLDKNVGTSKSVRPSAISINDGNGGGNYAVSYVNNTHSVITPAPLTLSTADVNKVYDGGLAANGTPVVTSGSLFGDTISGGSYAYLDKNAGTGKSVSASGITVNDGNGGGNYAVSYVNNTGSVITPAPLTLSTADVHRVYDGGLAANGTPVVISGTLFGDTISGGTYAYLDKNAGTGKSVSASGITVNDGNGGGNYAVSYVNNTNSVITPASLSLSASDVNKIYDGTVSANGAVIVTAGTLFNGDSVSGGSMHFNDRNVGTGKSVVLNNVTVKDDNNGANYSVTYVDNTVSAITPAGLTVSTAAVNKLYDGNVSAAGAPLITSGTLVAGDTISDGSFAFTDRYVGSNKTVVVSDIKVNDGNGGANYTLVYANNTSSSISASPQLIAATEQSGAIVASTLQNPKQSGADRRCILDQSKCIAALEGLPLTISGAGMRLPESLK